MTAVGSVQSMYPGAGVVVVVSPGVVDVVVLGLMHWPCEQLPTRPEVRDTHGVLSAFGFPM